MPAYIPELRDAIRTLVNTTWADVAENGVELAREIARIPFEAKAAAGELPFVVLDFHGVPSGEWGISNRADVFEVTIYRVNDLSEDADELMDNLELLRTALWPDTGDAETLSVGQVIEYPQITDSPALLMNQYFLNTGKDFYAGAVIARVVVGETA